MKKLSIAIDGPAAAGKSTIAKRVASILDYTYIDTGAMYRCVAYYCIKNGIDLDNLQAIESVLKDIHIELNGTKVLLNGNDVTNEIRLDEISKNASKVAAIKAVRTYLVERQREMASVGGVILDGRDIGTVVLPNADLKIYQVASSEARAKRRYDENVSRNLEADFDKIKAEIEARDYNDMHRQESPLKQAEDAYLLDTSDMTIEEVVSHVLALVKEKGAI